MPAASLRLRGTVVGRGFKDSPDGTAPQAIFYYHARQYGTVAVAEHEREFNLRRGCLKGLLFKYSQRDIMATTLDLKW